LEEYICHCENFIEEKLNEIGELETMLKEAQGENKKLTLCGPLKRTWKEDQENE
jgi:hypothetical protein